MVNYGQALQEGCRTQHPDAQWFPDAKMGLMITFGIHSVAGIQPSWAMVRDYPAGGDPRFYPPSRYYALAEHFNPQQYDPDRWMQAAASAGFKYAVLIAKHCDGYTLWPSSFGQMGTHRYMNGRDLVSHYVWACRKNWIKVGLYFSFTDWHHPLGKPRDPGLDYNRRGEYQRIQIDKEKDRAEFQEFLQFTKGQIEELLSRYGKVDLMWLDGGWWRDPDDPWSRKLMAESAAEVIPWIRRETGSSGNGVRP